MNRHNERTIIGIKTTVFSHLLTKK